MIVLGSLHAFSVFLLPLQTLFEAQRGSVSLVYSVALISLTVFVLLGHRIYPLICASPLLSGRGLMAAAGLVIASSASSLIFVYIGYGVVFGGASGIAYGFTLQLVSQALARIRGLAMGIVTGAYAIGAVIFAKVFSVLMFDHSTSQIMLYMAGFIGLTTIFVWAALKAGGARYESAVVAQGACEISSGVVFKMWMGYGLGSAAGLMAIGHATGIVVDAGGQGSTIVLGAMIVGMGNGIAGFIAGYLADRISLKALLIGLPVLSALALCVLLLVSQPLAAIAVLAVIGFAYGAIIAVYPAAVLAHFGAANSACVYGRVFTSWGTFAGIGSALFAASLPQISGAQTP